MRRRLQIRGVVAVTVAGAVTAALDGRQGWSRAFAEVAAEEVSTNRAGSHCLLSSCFSMSRVVLDAVSSAV